MILIFYTVLLYNPTANKTTATETSA